MGDRKRAQPFAIQTKSVGDGGSIVDLLIRFDQRPLLAVDPDAEKDSRAFQLLDDWLTITWLLALTGLKSSH